MIDIVSKDIKLTRDLLIGESDTECNTMYFETNECVREILDNFDIKGKSVLTVMASGDQAFHFYSKGAKIVDVFDINKLTIYYYYLRRWLIIYLNKSYPEWNFNSDFIKNVLKKVVIKNEAEAASYEYWSKCADILDMLDTSSKYLFNIRTINHNDDEFDCEGLSNILKRDHFNFYNIDISRRIRLPHKYDIIYTSNISDYVNRTGSYDSYRLNLKKHLKSNGIIISSFISGFTEPEEEMEILSKSFDFHKLNEIYQPHIRQSYSPGYYYTKRKFW